MLKILVSFLISVLSGLGVGGGGLFVIYLSVFTDTPQLAAQGMNLLFFLFSSGSSVIIHLQKRKIFPLTVALLALTGILGSLLGTSLAAHMNESFLRKAFGIMLVISGIFSLKAAQKSVPKSNSSGAEHRDKS